MSEDDLKLIIPTYQQKCFKLFNQNLVFETQITSLNKQIDILKKENESLKRGQKKVQIKNDNKEFSEIKKVLNFMA